MPNRCDNEAFIQEQIDLTAVNAYLAEKNRGEPAFKYTLFHIVVAALVKTVTLRPRMNRFIQGMRLYQRYDLTAAFVVRKQFTDTAREALAYIKFDDTDTMDSIHRKIQDEVILNRRADTVDNSTDGMDMLTKLPRFVLRFVMWALRRLDFYGRAPYSLVKTTRTTPRCFVQLRVHQAQRRVSPSQQLGHQPPCLSPSGRSTWPPSTTRRGAWRCGRC